MERIVSAADAKRKFSKLLRKVREGHSFIVISHGTAVAGILPVSENGEAWPGAHSALLERLKSQPVSDIGPWKRDDLYKDSAGGWEQLPPSPARHWAGRKPRPACS